MGGILTDDPRLDIAQPMRGMLEALRRRGPDGEGTVTVDLPYGRRLGLVHTRLAILDLSEAGRQPMGDPDSQSWITYNGEIYNHQAIRRAIDPKSYRSTSDTETLLRAWAQRGEGVLNDLRGMFSFALYDGRKQQLWLVRDRLGVKPLYLARVGRGTWLFSSEVRSILASGLVDRRLNRSAVESYLSLGAVPAPWTMVEAIESLMPAECLRIDLTSPELSGPHRSQYWRPGFTPQKGVPTPVPRRSAVEGLGPVLLESASLRMLSDVPVGLFLSGGIDSSSLLSLLTSQGHRPHAFAVSFNEITHDESAYARVAAHRFGVPFTDLRVSADDMVRDLDSMLGAYDQPSIDGFNTYVISKALRGAGYKVALSGLGGDELFAGYRYFRWFARIRGWHSRGLLPLMRTLTSALPGSRASLGKLREMIASGDDPIRCYLACRRVMSRASREIVLGSDRDAQAPGLPGVFQDDLSAAVAGLDSADAYSLMELATYTANMLLRDADQMSMAHALEVRVPLLDHILVETVAAIPGRYKLARTGSGRSKSLLTDALPQPLPSRIVQRPKRGFVLPWEHWLRRELRARARGVLHDPTTIEAAGLCADGVAALWDDFDASAPNVRHSDILCLLNLLAWVDRHGLRAA